MSFVPGELIRTTIELRGTADAEWLKRLPAIVADCERRWSLAVDSPFPELSTNNVAPAVRADGTPAVLKLSLPDEEFIAEARALRLFDGRGTAQLLELDLERGAMLLERLKPGTPLSTIQDDEETTSIAADVLRQLWRPVPPDHPFPLVSDWARGFVRLRRHFGGGTGPMPPALVEEAEALFAELIPSQAEPVLLHGDLHHGNILATQRQPWLAIDPKGVVASRPTTLVRCSITRRSCWIHHGPAKSSSAGWTSWPRSSIWTARACADGAYRRRFWPRTGAGGTAAACGRRRSPSPSCSPRLRPNRRSAAAKLLHSRPIQSLPIATVSR